jgi:hypothetical protein
MTSGRSGLITMPTVIARLSSGPSERRAGRASMALTSATAISDVNRASSLSEDDSAILLPFRRLRIFDTPKWRLGYGERSDQE